ncbi:MAG TPA: Calx-beta domain-containing protein, partial [Pontiella sp.]|nr:Calx-beta domain-containing protein [Pontiella sp.]
MALANHAMAADGDVVSVNFRSSGGQTEMPASDSAGAVVSRTNWNNTNGTNAGTTANISGPTSGKLVNDSGADSGLNISWNFGTTWAASNSGNANSRMMSGYVDNNTGVGTITVSNINASSYSVYAYIGSDGNGRTGTIGIDGADTYSFSTDSAGKTYPNDYVQTTDTGNGNPAANYAVWTNLTGSEFTLTHTRGSDNSGIHGIQIVYTGAEVSAVSVSATDAHANEAGQDTGTWTFTRIGNTSEALTVNYTLSGTATSGVDYTVPSTSSVSFGANETSTTLTLTPIDDSEAAEGDETATLTLTSGTGYTIDQATADINLHDDEGFDVNILIIGSAHDSSEHSWITADSEAFSPTGIATELQSILAGAGLGTANVVVEERYTGTTDLSGVNILGLLFNDTVSAYNLTSWFHYPYPAGVKASRWQNLQGKSGTQWDYVILIGDPYTIEQMPGLYAQGVAEIGEEVAKGSAETVLLMPWPASGSSSSVAHYKDVVYRAGRSGGYKVAPAALAWQAAGSPSSTQSHPNANGAYICAASIYSRIWGQSASTSTYPYDDTLADSVHTVVTNNIGAPQYSGAFVSPSPFRMFNVKGRAADPLLPPGGASTESNFRDKTVSAQERCGVRLGGDPFYFGRQSYDVTTNGQYDQEELSSEKVFVYPYHCRNQDNDMHISRFFSQEITVAHKIRFESPDFRILPRRLMWAQIHKERPALSPTPDAQHLNTIADEAVGAYMYTIFSGRCPVDPKPDIITDKWLAHKIGYETAWRLAT